MSPKEKFAGADLKFIEPDDLETEEEAVYVMSELDNVVASIGDQVNRAKSEAAATGRYGNRDWFHGAQRALKSAKRARVMAQERRAVLLRQERQIAQVSSERAFIEAAKLVLDRETYLRIWTIAVPGNPVPSTIHRE